MVSQSTARPGWLLQPAGTDGRTFLVTTSSQISSRLGWGEASASNGSLYGCAAGASARLHLLATSQRTRPQAVMSLLMRTFFDLKSLCAIDGLTPWPLFAPSS